MAYQVTGGACEGLQAASGRTGRGPTDLAENPGAGHVAEAGKLVMIAAPGCSRNATVGDRSK
jgi:hypothetical protein